ncbi:hypothetical protein [Pseudoalteromonas luteoviolacea]|uniref:Uncharacterized protein n=1 Tax=Pseudoalteromonas luteoviolacea S4054 TaxID=1129367 RepID=A0A0F6A574_9GAMM|nr:hypothetical protein [Pseudoalteromonas luteoviolacea]KKE81317.1 hypothetical protein N479_22540 [Pseudoalteromonas luteoviolacea S4054]KZN70674.1 hypothetical protein N481_20895 [Pseudoalteromonas luteoviolacea S4047-1]AOT07579.1 hypothetical protein S4054249_06875 [Pseudoalteromonas luteoviolacea]AOT12495.1 hypothetical protein S40542_06875 [Pseudoalteromonas luteoviolacea]AOT17409.1 hypothetical protein S4054_06875 [Pseudoalteromonas luteoviolacea]
MNVHRRERVLELFLPLLFAKYLARSPKLLIGIIVFLVFSIVFIIQVAAFAIYSFLFGTLLFIGWRCWHATKRLFKKQKSHNQ